MRHKNRAAVAQNT